MLILVNFEADTLGAAARLRDETLERLANKTVICHPSRDRDRVTPLRLDLLEPPPALRGWHSVLVPEKDPLVSDLLWALDFLGQSEVHVAHTVKSVPHLGHVRDLHVVTISDWYMSTDEWGRVRPGIYRAFRRAALYLRRIKGEASARRVKLPLTTQLDGSVAESGLDRPEPHRPKGAADCKDFEEFLELDL